MRVEKVVVLGGGSAGFMAAIAIKSKLPRLPVTVIRSKEIGIIGVGEGSTVSLSDFLHNYLRIKPRQFFELAQPTWKLGLKFIWGKRPYFNYTFNSLQLDGKPPGLRRVKAFYCGDVMEYEDVASALMTEDRVFRRLPTGEPAFHTQLAYHFENEKLVAFLEKLAASLGVVVLDDTVVQVVQGERGIESLRLASGTSQTADLFIDCSGFASLLLEKSLGSPFVSFSNSLYCDRAVVGGWDRTDEPIHPYTTCQTMDAGWCWQIEHRTRINRGYVYSSSFISDEQAEREFRQHNPKVGPTRIVKFRSGRHRECWVKNVVAIGNANGFVEPLEATALGAIAQQSRTLADTIVDGVGKLTPSARKHYNMYHGRYWDAIRDFLAIHYKYNTRLDTPFWRECREKTDIAGAEVVMELYRENGPSFLFAATALDPVDQFTMTGYVALLVGQQVPHSMQFVPTPAELAAWEDLRRRHREAALDSLTIPQALALIESPGFQWK